MSENLTKTSALKCVSKNDLKLLKLICDLAEVRNIDLEKTDDYGNTALLKGCYLGRYEAVEILLESGANIKATNCYGQNALTLATYGGHFCIARKLLRYRSYNDFNESSITPALCVATLFQHNRLIKFFKSLDENNEEKGEENIKTVHGLSAKDIEHMLLSEKSKEKRINHIYI